jgi:hypothetical protein
MISFVYLILPVVIWLRSCVACATCNFVSWGRYSVIVWLVMNCLIPVWICVPPLTRRSPKPLLSISLRQLREACNPTSTSKLFLLAPLLSVPYVTYEEDGSVPSSILRLNNQTKALTNYNSVAWVYWAVDKLLDSQEVLRLVYFLFYYPRVLICVYIQTKKLHGL